MACWNALFDQARLAFAQQRSAERARALGLSALTCLGRHTLSVLLCTAGQQFRDWSAAYRLFERERLDAQALVAGPTERRAGNSATRQPRGGPWTGVFGRPHAS
jgi:hypothetical protein